MLTHISIQNYTIVETLEMEFSGGMTVITGETGAGKSIMLDALGLCLGDRADPKAVRHGQDRADITACFDLSDNPAARDWLGRRDLLQGDECLLRRVVTAEGRSRAYINGSASTVQDCAELGGLLIDIHSQHAHQSLLRKGVQRQLLDAFAGQRDLARSVEKTASDWLRQQRELELLTGARDEQTARAQLLAYQVEELDALALQEGELAELEAELKQLANAEDILRSAHQALELCEELDSGSRRALHLMEDDAHTSRAAHNALELLDSAAIQLQEARTEIQHHIDGVEVNPERLQDVERRLEAIYDIARKHRVQPENLAELHTQLAEEASTLAGGGARIEELEHSLAELLARYESEAAKLSKQRASAARKLEKEAGKVLATLAMEHCRFEIALARRDGSAPHPQGREEVELLISTNPGSPAQPLAKIASGGELSRISLAVQVVTASSSALPCMVFDEVDVGIGGAVAEVVGRLLRRLAANTQVLCVTHLPQVASQGHQHLQVTKVSSKQSAHTQMSRLDGEQRTEEVARMLGGVKMTEQTLAHAREMLAQAEAG
ncbi:DNA repair protein RecN [Parahaliea mediterranea]|uniref:DNA repair protein RecN n=1 Tax=Parahaliea mediterranea TaxID=651086 RepID=UPI000E2FBE5F|nr:DNA repair protein RecN [Parahaliea mediterranea]